MPNIFGPGPNQVPGSSDLGSMAYQDNKNVNIDGGVITGSTKYQRGGFYNDTELTERRPNINLDFVNTKVLDSRFTFLRRDIETDASILYTGNGTYYDNKTFDLAEHNFSWYSEAPRSLTQMTATENVTTAPDGSSTAYQVFETTVDSWHGTYRGDYLGNNQFERNRVATFSMYAKFATSGRAYLSISRYSSASQYAAARWDITAGTLSSTKQLGEGMRVISTSITAVGNSWYRVSITTTCRSYDHNNDYRISLATDATTWTNDIYGAQQYVGSTSASMYWWGMQIEYSDTVGEYVRTTLRTSKGRWVPKLVTAQQNVPRFDHNPVTGESLGLLMENSKTNLIRNSEPDPRDSSFVNDWQALNSTVRGQTRGGLAGTVIVPTSSYSTISPWSQSIAGLLSLHTGCVSTASADFRWSFYINPMTWTGNIYFATVSGDGNTGFGTAILLFENGQYVGDTAYIKYVLADGTYILRDIPNTYNTGTLMRPVVYTTTTGNAWRKFWVSAFQYEANRYSTSYIKTYNRPVRRSAEMMYANDREFSSWFNNDQGTVFSESVHFGSNHYHLSVAGFSDGFEYQRMVMYVNSTTTVTLAAGNLASGESTTFTLPTTNGLRLRAAWSYKVNEEFLFALNNLQCKSIVQDVPFVDKFWIGTYWRNNYSENNTANGWIRRITYYPVKLLDQELLEMTQT